MSETPKPPERWSVRRWKQLERLDRLLRECESIDRANCVLERLKFIIKEAKVFREWSHRDDAAVGFIQFLKEQARYDYSQRKGRKAKKEANT